MVQFSSLGRTFRAGQARFILGDNEGAAREKNESSLVRKQRIRIHVMSLENKNPSLMTQALDAFNQAVRINPDNHKAYFSLGYMYSGLSLHKEAIEAYKQAVRVNPGFFKAHFNLGISYGELNLDKEAVEAYKQAIRVEPDNANAHFNLGIEYLILNDKEKALAHYNILTTLDKKKADEMAILMNE